MYVTKSGAGLKPAVLLSAASPHNCHVINKWEGVAMLWETRDIGDFLKERKCDKQVAQGHVHCELISVYINRCMVNGVVEQCHQFGTIKNIVIRIIIHQCVPIPCPNPIYEYMPIPIRIT